MSDYKSMTKILNEVYDGTALNVFDYGSATDVINMIHDPLNNALKVNIIGGGGGTGIPIGGTTDQVLVKATDADYDTEWADGGGGSIGPIGPTGPAGLDGTDGATGSTGVGIASGGLTDQVLVKVSATDYDTTWATASSGGSSPTQPMRLDELPVLSNWQFTSTEIRYRTWVPTPTYSRGFITRANTEASYSIFSMSEGEKITRLIFGVSTGGAGNVNVGIYRIGVNSQNLLVLTDKLRDLGSVSASSGNKAMDLSADPFIMATGEDYGAVAIVTSFDTNGYSFYTWVSQDWSGHGGPVFNADWYRPMGLYVKGLTNGVLPSDLSTNEYRFDTRNPAWTGISSQI
jgi:hypothetical protein